MAQSKTMTTTELCAQIIDNASYIHSARRDIRIILTLNEHGAYQAHLVGDDGNPPLYYVAQADGPLSHDGYGAYKGLLDMTSCIAATCKLVKEQQHQEAIGYQSAQN